MYPYFIAHGSICKCRTKYAQHYTKEAQSHVLSNVVAWIEIYFIITTIYYVQRKSGLFKALFRKLI